MSKVETAKCWDNFWDGSSIYGLSRYSIYLYESYLRAFRLWMPHFRNKRILEVGVGGGYLLMRITKLGAETYGVDVSKSAILKTKRIFSLNDVEGNIELQDATCLGLKKNYFDLVYSLGLIEHFKEYDEMERIIREMSRVAKPEGIVVASVPKRMSIYTPKKGFHMLTRTWPFGFERTFNKIGFLSLISKYLENLEIVGVDTYPSFLNLIPNFGLKKFLDSKVLVPFCRIHESSHPIFSSKIAHMLCAKGTPKK
ncbi:class I SAM-dependent methyltransferase [Thermoproteota archaeon]